MAALNEVSGIGPATAQMLTEHGIETVEDLAGTNVSRLMTVPGFSDIRASRVIEAARALVAGGMDQPVSPTPGMGKPGKEKEKKSKEKKSKEKKGKKDKAKKKGDLKKKNRKGPNKKKTKGKDKKKKPGKKK